MPAPATVPEFLELVRKSGLAPENKLNELLGRHRATGSPQTVEQAAAILVRDAQLTFFQSKQLKLGRYKRFTIGSKYRLLELIGAGGMGAVYLCEHTLMKRLVALKVLPVEKLDEQSNLDRFYREARAVAALDHPNIVRAYDIDQYEKLHFLVMEYVDGHSLQEIVARYALEKKLFDPVRAAHYIAQAAVGMQHAHELGMVHRDIKPGNLLLDRTGVIKVLDMGLARFFNKQQDSVTEKYDEKCVLGTADYLAPEQAVSNVVDVRADIYSLGGTLYFMLTGQTPFPEGTIAAKLVAHQTREPREVEGFRSDVPAGILAVLQKMMAKSVTDRYQQPIEVAEALAEWADHPLAPPPEREMPALCPLVQALMGPSDRSGAQTPLARALFGPGRGVFARSGSSPGMSKDRPSTSGPDPTTASNVAFPVQTPPGPRYSAGPNGPVGAPVSTGRASTPSTAPLQPAVSLPGPGPEPLAVKSPPKPRPKPLESLKPAPVAPLARSAAGRPWLFIAIGFCVALLCVGAAVVAFQLGRGDGANRGESPPTTPDGGKAGEQLGPNDLVPGAADKLLSPKDAAKKEGEVQTVEFKVRSVDGTGHLNLHAESDSDTVFVVRISPSYFTAPGSQSRALWEQTRKEFDGKVIRARGKIVQDPAIKGYALEVRVPKQILVVGEQR
jgi:serine/threonine protein kinase